MQHRKKYLLIIPTMEIGGAEMQALSFARYLNSIGQDVSIVSSSERGTLSEMCEKEGIAWEIIDTPDRFRYKYCSFLRKIQLLDNLTDPYSEAMAYALASYIKKQKYDVCISYAAGVGVWTGMAARYYSKPVFIWYQRDAGIYNQGDEKERRALNNYDIVLANGDSGKRYLKKTFSIDAEIVNNGVSIKPAENTEEEWRKRLNICSDDILCTMVANLTDRKDHMGVLEAWKKMKTSEKLPRLALAGSFGNEYDRLYAYAKNNDLLKVVHFLGRVKDVTGLLSATDICVFGAKSEGSPNGIIEAGMMGLPVVATDLPEIREVVSDNNIPFLFKSGDVESTIDAVKALCNDHELRHRIGIKNQEMCLSKFDPDTNFRYLVNIAESGGMLKK